MLDERKAAILGAIVREFVRTGEPVASRGIAGPLRASPATIRHEMSVLEEMGFLSQPHVSAGRVPTEHGYRWFVDSCQHGELPSLPTRDRRAISGAFTSEFNHIDEALAAASRLLSELTEAVGVVAAPPSRKNLLRRLELLRRDVTRATLLLIADTGLVEQGVVEFGSAMSEDGLSDLAGRLSNECRDAAIEDLPPRLLAGQGVPEERRLIAAEIEKILGRRAAERIFREGTAKILSDTSLDMPTARLLVGVLDKPLLISRLLEAAREAGSALVLIGQENPIREMRLCGVVFAPYETSSHHMGSLGVIGPLRMDYPHSISAVEEVARSLSETLEMAGV